MKKTMMMSLALILIVALGMSGCGKQAAAPSVELPEQNENELKNEVVEQVGENTVGDPASKTEKAVGAEHEHKYVVDPAVEPTCQETGLTEGMHCSECGEVLLAQEVLEKLDHSYVNGFCIWCQEKDPDYDMASEFGSSGGIELPWADG